jgi:hypothetical protein
MDEGREILERLELIQQQLDLLRAYMTARFDVLKAAISIVALKAGCQPEQGELAKLLDSARPPS